jgi:hypothetical protein
MAFLTLFAFWTYFVIWCLYQYFFFFFSGATAQRAPGPPDPLNF